MSQNITPEKLDAFAKAVEKAAHEHLGSNGVRGVMIALDRFTYYPARMEFIKSPYVAAHDLVADNLEHGFTHAYGFIRVACVDDLQERERLFKRQKW